MEKIDEVIASRVIELHGSEVTITIGKPEKFPDGSDYYCCYRIVGVGDGKVRRAGGADSVQALMLALERIGIDLATSERATELRWLGQAELGFPLPASVRDSEQ